MKIDDINDLIMAVTHSNLPIERIEELLLLLFELCKKTSSSKIIVDELASIPESFWQQMPNHINCKSWIVSSFTEPTDDDLRALWGEYDNRI